MLDEPVYLRPPDYLYRLRSAPGWPMFTGTIAGDRRLLLVAGCAVEFDAEGHLVGLRDGGGQGYPIPQSLFPADFPDRGCPDEQAGWVPELGFRQGPIEVRRFWFPDRWIGISDLPLMLWDLPRDPDLFTDKQWTEVRASDWFAWGNFAFRCGTREVYIGREGQDQLYVEVK